MERRESIALLRRYVHGEPLIRHCIATGAIMKATAGTLSGDPDRWEEIGILHDIDFECVKEDMHQHGITGAKLLRTAGVPEDICDTVRRHNHILFSGTYEKPVDIVLQAADSASGLIIACALVKGGRLTDVSAKTVMKKAKEKSFAAGCDRDRIALIGQFMEIPVFYESAIAGMMEIRTELGLE